MSDAANTCSSSPPYRTQYEDVRKLLESDNWDACVAAAEYNLT
jgi:hypothetical protein